MIHDYHGWGGTWGGAAPAEGNTLRSEQGEGPHPRKGTHCGRNAADDDDDGGGGQESTCSICGEWSPVLINNQLFVFTRGGWSLVPARKTVARQSPGLLLPLMLLFAVDVPRDG